MTTTTKAKLIKLTTPSTTSSYYLKDLKSVWDYDPLDKTSPEGPTVIIGYMGKRFKLAGTIVKPVDPIPEPIPDPIVIPPPPPTNVIDVAARYGIKTGTTIDNTAALLKLNADFKGY